jgi:membrane fusion protein (multidrug efflux system)
MLVAEGCKPKPAPAPAPPKVRVVTVTPRDVPIYQQRIGTLDGYPNANIRAQVAGYLMKQDYAEGSKVKQGDLLFEIDPRPFQAVLDQALAKQDQDQAMLGMTEIDVKRYTPLAKEQAVSQQEMDNAVQSNLMAKAAVVADKAAVESARLNLGFTKITSPIDGIAGLALAQIGDLVGPGTSNLTTVSTVDPIRAYFNISEQFYLQYSRLHTESAESEIPLNLVLSDGTTYPQPGKWLFTSRQIDVNTGTMQVAAEFRNPESLLRPGQYALVRAKTETRKGALLVPQRAVAELQGSYQVAVVETNKVLLKKVVVGEQIGSDWLIDSGLPTNAQVLAEGTQKVTNGMIVDPQPFDPTQTNTTDGGKQP